MGEKLIMSDKEILEEVYHRLQKRYGWFTFLNHRRWNDIRSFIEEEWQKRDDLERWRNEMFNLADDEQKYNIKCVGVQSYSVDAAEIERHVGLEIGEDGTVTGIK